MKNKIFLAAPLLLAASAQAQDIVKPNIVVLFVDDLGWADLGYQNPKFHTPNIDALKSEGVYMERAYVPTPTSSPSRATLLTGKEALRCGFVRHIYDVERGNESSERSEFQVLDSDPGHMKSRAWLPLEEVTYAEKLHESGYYNYFIGKWHLGHEPYFPIHQGFDDMYGTCEHGHPKSYYQPFFNSQNPFLEASSEDYLTELLTDGAVDFIENYDKSEPFLLNLWYYTVHGPHYGRKDYVEYYLNQGMSKEDANYAAMVRSMDDSVGRIREALAKSGEADNTVIVYTSDQGGAFVNRELRGGKKGGDALAEGGARVPMIVYYPGMEGMGTTYSKPVCTTDIYPTLVEIASGKKCTDSWINGESLMTIINGGEQADRDIFLHRSYEDQNSALIQGDWKLIKYRSGRLELYNIASDISEKNNLYKNEPERTQTMLEKLQKWQDEATPEYLK